MKVRLQPDQRSQQSQLLQLEVLNEQGRPMIWFGSWLTGVIVIAYASCGDEECVRERDKMLAELGEEPWRKHGR